MAYTLNIQNPGDWLYDISYMNTCSGCGERFFGPKRASHCWEHTSESMREAWIASFQEPKNLPMEPQQMSFPFAKFDPPTSSISDE